MSFGISPGDLVSLANVAHTIYEALKNAPEELRQKLMVFEDISKELKRLNQVLNDAGIERYPESDELEKALLAANAYFQKFKSLLPGQGNIMNRVTSTTRFKFDKTTVDLHVREMERHRKSMEQFVIHAILYKSLKDSQLQQTFLYTVMSASVKPSDGEHVRIEHNPNRDNTSRLLENTAYHDQEISSSIRRAIEWGRHPERSRASAQDMVPSPRNEPLLLPPITTPLPTSTPTTPVISASSIADLVEDSYRFWQENPNSASPEELQRTMNLLSQLKRTVTDSPVLGPITLPRRPSELPSPRVLPLSPASTEGRSNGSIIASPVFSPTESAATDTPGTTATSPIALRESSIGASYVTSDTILPVAQKSMSILSNPEIQHALIFKTAISDQYQIRCKLRRYSREAAEIDLPALLGKEQSEGATPAQLLGVNGVESLVSDGNVFEHWTDQYESFPHIPHPSLWQKPHKVNFYQQQCFRRDGGKANSPPRWVQYNCQSKSDRKLLCEILFRKKLLATAGIETTSIATACNQQSIMLWWDQSAEGQTELPVTITLPSNYGKTRSKPDHIREYVLLGCENLQEARKSDKRLKLWLRETSDRTLSPNNADRRHSDLSLRSTLSWRSQASTGSERRRSSSSTGFLCEITFSKDTDDLKQLKKKFLDAIPKSLAAGTQN